LLFSSDVFAALTTGVVFEKIDVGGVGVDPLASVVTDIALLVFNSDEFGVWPIEVAFKTMDGGDFGIEIVEFVDFSCCIACAVCSMEAVMETLADEVDFGVFFALDFKLVVLKFSGGWPSS
jgi:hypothetical protein